MPDDRICARRPRRAKLGIAIAGVPMAIMWGHASAWSQSGHAAIAVVAEHQLSAKARAMVTTLLAEEPRPTLSGVASWADITKDASTRRWHFVNLPESCDYDASRDCPQGQCVVQALDQQIGRLYDRRLTARDRGEALKYVVHLIGDAAQPFHAFKATDGKGGLRIQVRWEGRGTNVHRFWDEELLSSRWQSAAALAGAMEIQHQGARQTFALGSPQRWSEEACRSARQFFVRSGEPIDQQYLQRALPVAEDAVWLAGLRLAAVVNKAAE